jgi:hypothetical protein
MKRLALSGAVVLSALVFGMFIACGSGEDGGSVLEELSDTEYAVYSPSFVYSAESKLVSTRDTLIFTSRDAACLAEIGISPDDLKGGSLAADGTYIRKWDGLQVDEELVVRDDYETILASLQPFLPPQINPADINVESAVSFILYDIYDAPIGTALHAKGIYGEGTPGSLSVISLHGLRITGFVFQ